MGNPNSKLLRKYARSLDKIEPLANKIVHPILLNKRKDGMINEKSKRNYSRKSKIKQLYHYKPLSVKNDINEDKEKNREVDISFNCENLKNNHKINKKQQILPVRKCSQGEHNDIMINLSDQSKPKEITNECKDSYGHLAIPLKSFKILIPKLEKRDSHISVGTSANSANDTIHPIFKRKSQQSVLINHPQELNLTKTRRRSKIFAEPGVILNKYNRNPKRVKSNDSILKESIVLNAVIIEGAKSTIHRLKPTIENIQKYSELKEIKKQENNRSKFDRRQSVALLLNDKIKKEKLEKKLKVEKEKNKGNSCSNAEKKRVWSGENGKFDYKRLQEWHNCI